VIELSFVS